MKINKDYIVCVISHNRAESIPKEYNKEDWYFIVGDGGKESYQKAGCKNVIEGGNLIDSRNKALELGDEKKCICLQLSDDCGKCFIGEEECDINRVIEYAVELFKNTNTALMGINPVFNKFYQGEGLSDGFVIGDFTLTKPNVGIRYDKNLRLKEDYDFSLQYLQRFRSAKRMKNVIMDWKHYSNKGGAVDIRNDEIEKETCIYLRKKWGMVVKRNTKRKGYEILIARDWYNYI